jgi:leader peptidase (prepilin peptidase)/N-methyltransferase
MQPALFIIGAVVTFIYGTAIGSFLNVCIYRLPRAESLIHPPSHCPRCDTRLRIPDLMPLLSYLLLRGKCRYCRERISPRYFIIELVTGLLFAASWASLALRPDTGYFLASVPGLIMLVALLVWVACMLVTFMIDLDTTWVIEPVTWIAMAMGVIAEVMLKYGGMEQIGVKVAGMWHAYLPAAVPGMMIGFMVFVGIDLFGGLIFRKPSMGVGDAYIGAAIGAMLGPGLALLSFGMAVLVAVVVGVALLVRYNLSAAAARKAAAPQLEPEEAEPPRGYLPLKAFVGGTLALGLLWVVQTFASAALARQFGNWNSLASLLAPFTFGVLVIVALILLEPLWPKQTVEGEDEEAEEELPEGNYIPFGPFLTACAVLVALMPHQVLQTAVNLWTWYVSRW